MRDEEPQIGHCHVLRIAVGGLKEYARITCESACQALPAKSSLPVARCADLIDTMLQAIEGGSFYGHIGPF